ncbi:MucR family transcriptional regulator [Sphingomonas sp. Leaf257]|uniref:MucR family transcriptional regulator n=1 Tax=Sphingomonas sp. Leaf257 TaxID=1736309 RepID=UPI0006FC445A|nr:MucR family transcriptional regulator [Sphingomonas sp. Leaf257]KQO56904.1 transcriptional regulator [Sphingomonas sp. Leaf257]
MTNDTANTNATELATDLTIAWLANPNTRSPADEVPAFLRKMHETVSALLGGGATSTAETETPAEYVAAVTARKSLASRDHIISMIDGKPYKTLRRHLATHGLTPEEYRARYNLKADYPMVAESYSESRRAMAKRIGLGRKPGQSPKAAQVAKPEAAKNSRKGNSVAAAKAAAQAHLSGSAA